MAEERKVSVDLEVTKSGETGAFKEAAGEIKQLDQAAAESTGGLESLAESEGSAADAAGDLKTAVAGAGQAAGNATEPMEGLGEAAAGTGQKSVTTRAQLEDLFLKIGTSMVALHEAERALQQIEEGLNTVAEAAGGTGKEFDGLGSKFGAFTASVTQFLSKVTNIDDAFAAFANTSGSLVTRLDAAKEALDGLSPAAQKFKDTITGTDEKLQDQADAMGRVIGQMETAGDVHEREAERIGQALAKISDKAKAGGVDLGKGFDELLKKYPELDQASADRATAVEEEATAAEASAADQVAALNTIKDAADPADTSVGEAAGGVTELGAAAGTASTGVQDLATGLTDLPTAAAGLATAFESLRAMSLESLVSSVATLREEIQGATADANALQAALAAADVPGGEATEVI